MARAVFMGSDAFSLPILKGLLERGSALRVPVEVVGVVTQPDRPAGRGRRLSAGPVKTLALREGVAVLQPQRVRDSEAIEALRSLRPDVVVVASYGQILPRSLLEMPAHGCLNLHPSLLPLYRGPSPVVATLLSGDRETGTTLILLEQRMDAGPVLAQVTTPVGQDETAGELELRLAQLSDELLLRELPGWLEGATSPLPQDESRATYTRRVSKEDGRIDWSQPAETLARQVRAYNPWPSAYTFWGERQLRVLRARHTAGREEPGRVAGLVGDALTVGTGEGLLLAEELQLAGGRHLTAPELVRGRPELLSARLGEEGSWS